MKTATDLSPMNVIEYRKRIKYYELTDPNIGIFINWVSTMSISLLIEPVPLPIKRIAYEFWLFGNVFYEYEIDAIHNPDLVCIKCIPITNNCIYSIYNKDGDIIKDNANLIHIKRSRNAYDILGEPLPVINEDSTFGGFNKFHPNELSNAINKLSEKFFEK
jgi:hypothetical protein